MRDLNKKILGIAVTLLLAAMFVAPALAAPATKIEGVEMYVAAGQIPYPGFPHMVSHGTISHSKGYSDGTVTLIIPINPSDPLVLNGGYASEWIGKGKISEKPAETELLIMGTWVLTFTGEGTTGTFEGVTHRTIIGWDVGPPPGPLEGSVFIDRAVLHGTGDFQGWTLKLSYDGEFPPVPAEGYLVIPN